MDCCFPGNEEEQEGWDGVIKRREGEGGEGLKGRSDEMD